MASSNDPAALLKVAHAAGACCCELGLQLLDLAIMEDSPIKTQHMGSLFASVALSCERIDQPELLWQFLRDSWRDIEVINIV